MRFLPSQASRRRTVQRLLGPGGRELQQQRQRERRQLLRRERRERTQAAAAGSPVGWPQAPSLRGGGVALPDAQKGRPQQRAASQIETTSGGVGGQIFPHPRRRY